MQIGFYAYPHIRKQEALALSRSFLEPFEGKEVGGTAAALCGGPLMPFDVRRAGGSCLHTHGQAAAARAACRELGWLRSRPGAAPGPGGNEGNGASPPSVGRDQTSRERRSRLLSFPAARKLQQSRAVQPVATLGRGSGLPALLWWQNGAKLTGLQWKSELGLLQGETLRCSLREFGLSSLEKAPGRSFKRAGQELWTRS